MRHKRKERERKWEGWKRRLDASREEGKREGWKRRMDELRVEGKREEARGKEEERMKDGRKGRMDVSRVELEVWMYTNIIGWSKQNHGNVYSRMQRQRLAHNNKVCR